jgi:streptogramin lyase
MGLSGLHLGEPVDLGAPLQDVAVLHGVLGEEEGEPVMYYTAAGNPAAFHVVALRENRLKGVYPLPGAGRSWGHALAADGRVYIGGVGEGSSGHLYRYDPEAAEVENLGAPVPGHKFIWALTAGEDGNIYGGTWEGGHVFRYDPQANSFLDYGRIHPGEDYARSIAWHGGVVYVGTGTRNGRVWRLDPESGARRPLEIPRRPEYEEQFDRMGTAYHVQVAAGHLFTFFSTEDRITLIYDLEQGEWWEETFYDTSGPLLGIESEDERFFYLFTRKGVRRIDLETRESEIIRPGSGGFRGGGWVALEVDGERRNVLAAVTYGGSIGLIDPERADSRALPPVAVGQATPLQALETGPDGLLYLSGYMGTTAAVVDPADGQVRTLPMGQAEGIGFLGDRVIWAEYPHALIKIHQAGGRLKPEPVFHVGHHQDRPFAITSGGGRVFLGTIPGYGRLGGALTVYDPAAPEGEEVRVYPDIVQDQSIIGLAYAGGRIYGSTSVFGGLGIDPRAEQGRVFIWDLEKEEVVLERELELPEAAGVPRVIGGLSLGPDGLVWGAVNGTLFALDPGTLEVVRHEILYPQVKSYSRWRPAYLRWGADGLLYCNVAGHVTIVDPETWEFLPTGCSSGLMTLGPDGSIFYVDNPRLMKVEVRRED